MGSLHSETLAKVLQITFLIERRVCVPWQRVGSELLYESEYIDWRKKWRTLSVQVEDYPVHSSTNAGVIPRIPYTPPVRWLLLHDARSSRNRKNLFLPLVKVCKSLLGWSVLKIFIECVVSSVVVLKSLGSLGSDDTYRSISLAGITLTVSTETVYS